MEINWAQITRFKDKTKYVCANFDPLIGKVARTTPKKKVNQRTGRVSIFIFYLKNVPARHSYKTSSDLLQSTLKTIISG